MISVHQIKALLQVQLRSMWHSLHTSKAGGGVRVSVALAVLWYGFWAAIGLLFAVMPNLIGSEDLETALPGLFLFIMGYWQLTPLLTLSLGVSLDMRRTRIYPVSTATLFSVECGLRLGTGAEMLLILAGLWAGFATAGSMTLSTLTAGFLLFVVFNMFLSAAIRNFVERVFRQRRLREVVVVVMVCILLIPQALIWSETLRGLVRKVLSASRDIPQRRIPSGLAARIATGEAGWDESVALVAMIGIAALLAYWQFHLSITRLGGSAASRRNATGAMGDKVLRGITRGIGDPIAVLVEKEVRSLWRSPRFRLPFFMGFTFGVFAWLPILGFLREPESAHWTASHAITFISLYSFLLLGPVMFLNRFGFDRNAAQAYFWYPVSLERLLLAKNLAACFYALLQILFISMISGWFGMISTPLVIGEALLVGGIALLYLLSVGNYISVRFPIASNPDRISRGGMGHGIRSAAQFLLFPLSLAPVLAVIAAAELSDNVAATMGGVFAVTAGGILLYIVTLTNAARTMLRTREYFVSQLAQSEGPLTAE